MIALLGKLEQVAGSPKGVIDLFSTRTALQYRVDASSQIPRSKWSIIGVIPRKLK
jgi:hypothetical protein